MEIGKVDDKEIGTVSEFVSHISTFEKRHIAQWFYRGHSKSEYKLIPSLYRLKRVLDESFTSWEELEKYLLRKFKQEGAQYTDTRNLDDTDLLALAQHHGLPTRLLDWTTNPLIALYFAVEKNYSHDSNLWCLGFPSVNNCWEEGTLFSQRLGLDEAGIILFPNHINSRIVNQCGCFTVHNSEHPLNEEEDLFEFIPFNKVIIPQKRKKAIRAELYDMGIHEAFIYPGLDAVTAKMMYELNESNFRFSHMED